MKQTNDIAIVGAGVTGTSILINIVEKWITASKKGRITLLEKTVSLGPGLPFNTQQPRTLRINDPFSASDIVLDNPEYSFLNWLKLENTQGTADIVELGVGETTLKNRFPSRAIYGRYCAWALKHAIARAIKHGISIDIESPVEVIDALKTDDESWELSLSNNTTCKTKNLILATGHMPSDHYVELEGQSGFYATPWEDLKDIPKDEPVIVLGSGLTAIDTAKKLRAQGHIGEITFISKSGSLPPVKPPLHNQKVELQFLNRENVDKPGLTLNEYLTRFQEELNLHVKPSIDFTKKLTTKLDSITWLKKNIELVEKGEVRTWQLLLDEIYFNSLPHAWKHFSEADKATLLKEYFGPYLKWAAGTPLANAKEVLEMLESGQLKLISGLPQITKNEKDFQFTFENSSIPPMTVKHVINATGMGHNIDRNNLLQKMHSNQLLQKASQGGIEVDAKTYQVYPDQSSSPYSNLYSAGPCIFGSNPAVYAIEASAMAGEEIGKTMKDKPTQAPLLGFFKLPGQKPVSDTTNLHTGEITRTRMI